ncbi:MAG: galactokinase [Spirochaetaceae bacterium]|jgi:galactokinase|nr:galactokinase [Spirochaetaceae bacterium]
MTGKELLNWITTPAAAAAFEPLYGAGGLETARKRYTALVEGMLRGFSPGEFPETRGDVRFFTAPGRTELGGNHTDHNQGKVLAASIQLDAVALAAPREDNRVLFRSTGYPDVAVDLSDLSVQRGETGSTEALVRGVAAELVRRGTAVRGFTANADSVVLPGSGLSSSAAMEVLLGRIFDTLYGTEKRSALELAQIGQKAENLYFGKPSGLMDQTACATGGAVAIDFADPHAPRVQPINFDLSASGYTLCVVNTHGSHADLTPDYAAIPEEMKAVAAFFGKSVLREVSADQVLSHGAELRKAAGDRAVIRALHYFEENQRVEAMGKALKAVSAALSFREKQGELARYLNLVNKSGDSSWELLQNIYSPRAPREQGISLALSVTRQLLRDAGACRVHGGGFAGTIQAYIPLDLLDSYRHQMEGIFGAGAVTVLQIRPIGVEPVPLTPSP